MRTKGSREQLSSASASAGGSGSDRVEVIDRKKAMQV